MSSPHRFDSYYFWYAGQPVIPCHGTHVSSYPSWLLSSSRAERTLFHIVAHTVLHLQILSQYQLLPLDPNFTIRKFSTMTFCEFLFRNSFLLKHQHVNRYVDLGKRVHTLSWNYLFLQVFSKFDLFSLKDVLFLKDLFGKDLLLTCFHA